MDVFSVISVVSLSWSIEQESHVQLTKHRIKVCAMRLCSHYIPQCLNVKAWLIGGACIIIIMVPRHGTWILRCICDETSQALESHIPKQCNYTTQSTQMTVWLYWRARSVSIGHRCYTQCLPLRSIHKFPTWSNWQHHCGFASATPMLDALFACCQFHSTFSQKFLHITPLQCHNRTPTALSSWVPARFQFGPSFLVIWLHLNTELSANNLASYTML